MNRESGQFKRGKDRNEVASHFKAKELATSKELDKYIFV